MSIITTRTHLSIIEDLIEDSIFSICLEIHMSEKFKYAFKKEYCDFERNSLETIKDSSALESNKGSNAFCYICSKYSPADRFAKHLAGCMGFDTNIKRKASQKITSFKESESDSDCSDLDARPSNSKRKTSKKGNNNRSKQSRHQGNSDNSLSYIDMTQEARKAFFDQYCGVLTKRNKLPCKMNFKCSRHSEEERKNVRNFFLSDMNDEFMNNEMIDVECTDSEQIFMPS